MTPAGEQPTARWGPACRALGSTLLAFSGPLALAESLEDGALLWETAVRRGVEAGKRARGKRKREAVAGGDEASSVPAPVAALLSASEDDVSDAADAYGQKHLCEELRRHTGLETVVIPSLGKTEPALPGPVGLLLLPPRRAAAALARLEELLAEGGAERAGLQEGCVVVILQVPSNGLLVTRPEDPPFLAMPLERDEKEKGDVLNLVRWDALQAAVKEAQGLASVAGLALPSAGAAAFYGDGHLEALQEPLVRLLPKGQGGGKAGRYELLEVDDNALKLPSGFAPHEGPYALAARWLAEGSVLAFTGAGTSKESGVPTYRDGNGLWKKYDAMEVSSIAGLVGEPAKMWDFEREFNNLLMGCMGANDGHRALAELEALGCVDMVVTQNVDGFHQAAGSKEVLELHGSEVHAICLNKECGKRTEMSRIFGSDELWSPTAPGWGIRWPEEEGDSELQKIVRAQLTELMERSRRKKPSLGSSDSDESGEEEGKAVGSGSASEKEEAGGGSGSESEGGSSSSSAGSLPKHCVPKALSEAEKAAGRPMGRVPICPHCKVGILKPDGIFFGEALETPVLKRALGKSVKSSLVLMVGTSGQVDPAAKLPLLAKLKNGAKILEVNIKETRLSKHADLRLLGPSAEVLPRLQRLVAAHPRTAELQSARESKLAQAGKSPERPVSEGAK